MCERQSPGVRWKVLKPVETGCNLEKLTHTLTTLRSRILCAQPLVTEAPPFFRRVLTPVCYQVPAVRVLVRKFPQ
jgi:hypothetical protein